MGPFWLAPWGKVRIMAPPIEWVEGFLLQRLHDRTVFLGRV